MYDTLITATTAHELTENGTLCALEPYIMTKINMEDTNYIGGEYSARAIRARSADILGDVVANYKQHALGLRSICFCATIQHCDDVAKQFTDAGIPVAVYTSKTSLAEREQILKDLKDPITGSINPITSTNIMKGIAMKRLIGSTTALAALPYGLVEGAQAINGVSDEEAKAANDFCASLG